MSTPFLLTDLQLRIMRILWDRQEATVAVVHETLRPDRGLALTTIATVISRMHKRSVLSRRTDGRQYLYRPACTREEVRRTEVDGVARRMFHNDTAAFIEHLLSEGSLTANQLDQVKLLIHSKEQSLREA